MTSGNYRVQIVLDGIDNASQDIRRVQDNLRGMDTGARQAGLGFGSLTTAIGGLAAAWGTMQLGEKLSELYQLGKEAQNARNTFEALSGGAAAAASNLEQLRVATRGVVDDTTLMSSANQMLMMNIASTGEEAAKLANYAVTLGKAMGRDAKEALEDFTTMLANQSIPRLDTFGISSAAVRARIDELTKSVAGLSREEAFRQAVLEQGAIAMERLGSSVEQNVSQVDKLGTRLQNVLSDVGSAAYGIIEGLAGVVNAITASGDEVENEIERRTEQHKRHAVDIATAYQQSLLGLPPGEPTAPPSTQPFTGTATGMDIIAGARAAGESVILSTGQTVQQLYDELQWVAEGYEKQTGAVITTMEQLQEALEAHLGMEVTLAEDVQQAAEFWVRERYVREHAGAQPTQWGPITGAVDESGVVRGADPYFAYLTQTQRDREASLERARQAIEAQWQAQWLNVAQWQAYRYRTGEAYVYAGPRAAEVSERLRIRRMQEAAWEPTREQMTAAEWQAYQYRTGMMYQYAGPRVQEMEQRQQQQAAQMGLDFLRGVFERGRDVYQTVVDAGERIADSFARAREQAEHIVTTFMATGVKTGPEAEWYSLIAEQITDPEERARFERAMGLTTWRNDLPGVLASLPAGEREMAAQALGAMFASGQAPASMAEAMRAAGYFQIPGTGTGKTFTVTPGMTDTEAMQAGGFSSLQEMYSAMGWKPGRVQVGTFQTSGGWRRIVGPGGPEEQGDAGFAGISNTLTTAAKQFETDLDQAIEKPRRLPVTLDIIAETEGVQGPFRTLVVQVVQEWMRDNGGQATPTNNKTGSPVKSAGVGFRAW